MIRPSPWLTLSLAFGLAVAACSGGAASVRADGGLGNDGSDGGQVVIPDEGGAPGGGGTSYHVGPGQALANIGDVPWYSLGPGDTVYIHQRPEPYHEKFLVSGRGTPTQWIRVLGVPGPGGELPIISGDGATTSKNMHHHWQDPSGDNAIQWSGVVQIAVHEGEDPPLPGYIEIANLQVQDGYRTYKFTAENGKTASYEGFAACIYAKSAQHLLIRGNVLANCGQAIYTWTGDGTADAWWAGLAVDTIVRGNEIHGNGNVGSYSEHQTYTESDGVIIERNHYGPQRAGSLGSQLKDRSVGTVIRYNHIEQSPEGWSLDLVEPEESAPTLMPKPAFKQAFVYGNLIVNKGVTNPSVIHWNEDHYTGHGRAEPADGRLYVYANTLVTVANQAELGEFDVFNLEWGGYDCPESPMRGVIDLRNNLIVALPRSGSSGSKVRLGYCGLENFDLGVNWISSGWTAHGKTVTGMANVVSPAGNDPGFVDVAAGDFHLKPGASAAGIAGQLAPAVTSNALGLDLRPTAEYVSPRQVRPRPEGASVGAFGP